MQMNSEWNMKKEAGRNAGERKTVFSGTCLLQRSEIWKVRPVKPPAVRRQCPGCGTAKSIYESTGKFRVNANGSRLDVWLIYRCVRCKKSWNMEILERMETGRLSEEERLSYLENREEAALRAACSSALLRKNRAEALWETMEYEVEKSAPEEPAQERSRSSSPVCQRTAGRSRMTGGASIIRIQNEFGLPIRISRLLAEQLGLSGGKLKELAEAGRLEMPEGTTLRTKLGGEVTLFFTE